MKSNKMKIIAGIIIILGLPILSLYAKAKYSQGINVTKWDNYYDENNIVFFYEDSYNENNVMLDKKYKISEYVSNEEKEFDRVLKATTIVKELVEKDDVPETGLDNAMDILKKKGDSKKVNFKDMAIIARDIVNCTGVKTRIGVFRKGDAQKTSNYEYYVLEYWSTELNKWVMVDFLDKGYFEKDTKLSAVEVLNGNLRKIPYNGNTGQKDYKNNLNKYLDSYSVNIENSNKNVRSNCMVTYIKDDSALQLKYKNKYASPTIFTKNTQLFEKSPFNDLVYEDKKAYLLICPSKLTESSKDKSKNTEDVSKNSADETKVVGEKVLISAFKDDKVIKSYYLKINGSDYEKIEGFKEIKLENGTTTIELSIDGSTSVSSVSILKN